MRMPQRLVSPFASIGLVMSALLLSPAPGRADTLVRLLRWEGPSVLMKTHAPGILYFRLIARAQRESNAYDPGTYSLRVALPDAQVDTQPVPARESPSRRLTILLQPPPLPT